MPHRIVILNLIQDPLRLLALLRVEKEWMLKQVQHDEALKNLRVSA